MKALPTLIDYVTTVLAAHTTVASNPEICELSRQLAIWQTLASEESAAEAASAVEVKDHKRELFLVLTQAALSCKDRLANTIAHKLLGECFTHPEILSYQATGKSGPEKSLLATFYPNYHPTKEFAEKHLTTTSGDATPIPGASLPKLLKTLHSPAQHIIFSNLDTNTLFRLKESHPKMEALLIQALFIRKDFKARQFQTHCIKTLVINKKRWKLFQNRHLKTPHQIGRFTTLFEKNAREHCSQSSIEHMTLIDLLMKKMNGLNALPNQKLFENSIASAANPLPQGRALHITHKNESAFCEAMSIMQHSFLYYSNETLRKAIDMLITHIKAKKTRTINRAAKVLGHIGSYPNSMQDEIIQFLLKQVSSDSCVAPKARPLILKLIEHLPLEKIRAFLEDAEKLSGVSRDGKALQIIGNIAPWLSPEKITSLKKRLAETLHSPKNMTFKLNILYCLSKLQKEQSRTPSQVSNSLVNYFLSPNPHALFNSTIINSWRSEHIEYTRNILASITKESVYIQWLNVASRLIEPLPEETTIINPTRPLSLGLQIIPGYIVHETSSGLRSVQDHPLTYAIETIKSFSFHQLPEAFMQNIIGQLYTLAESTAHLHIHRQELIEQLRLKPFSLTRKYIQELHTHILNTIDQAPPARFNENNEAEISNTQTDQENHINLTTSFKILSSISSYFSLNQAHIIIERINSLSRHYFYRNDENRSEALVALYKQLPHVSDEIIIQLLNPKQMNKESLTIFKGIARKLSRTQAEETIRKIIEILQDPRNTKKVRNAQSIAFQMLAPLAQKISPRDLKTLKPHLIKKIEETMTEGMAYRDSNHTQHINLMNHGHTLGSILLNLFVVVGDIQPESLQLILHSIHKAYPAQRETILKHLYQLLPIFTENHFAQIAGTQSTCVNFTIFQRVAKVVKGDYSEPEKTRGAEASCSLL